MLNKMEGGSGSGSRSMRSLVGPEWSLRESLILVNEIAAVEADCLKALSTYQKWKIISENCTALDVPRTSNQCRRKWDALLADYNMFMRSRSKTRSKCNSHTFSDGQFLPPNFDHDLFKAIHNLVIAKENQSDTDPDSDPEAHLDLSELIAQLGSKRRRGRLFPMKHFAEDETQKSQVQEKYQKGYTEEKPCNSRLEEMAKKEQADKKSQKRNIEGKVTSSLKEKEQMMVAKLHENAEFIVNIVKENAKYGRADLSEIKDFQSEFVRRQGDKLIACLGEIANTLNQFSDHVQECE